MKIVHIQLVGPYTDGWLYQDNILPKYHKRMGYNVEFITTDYFLNNNGLIEYAKDFESYVDNNGIIISRLREKKSFFLKKLKRYQQLIPTLIKTNPDIIFIHGIQFLQFYNIIKFAKSKKNIRIIVDNHADLQNSAKNILSKYILHKFIWRKFAKYSEDVVSVFFGVTPSRVQFLTQIYKIDEKKCDLLPLGVDDDYVKEIKENISRIKASLNIPLDKKMILTGGKIDYKKKEIIDLASMLGNEKNYVTLIFGSVTEDLENSFYSSLSENVKFIGWLDANAIYQYFVASDLIIFPGLHSVLWEIAAGIGVPVLIRDIGQVDYLNRLTNVSIIKSMNKPELLNQIRVSIKKKNNLKVNKVNDLMYSEIAKKSLKFH